MIKKILVENFKSLKNINVSVKGLNVLTGINGMGKSSFIQALLLLMQSEKLESQIITLNGLMVQIGLGHDALYQFAQDEHITLGLTIDNQEYSWKFDYKSDKDELLSEKGYSTALMGFFRANTKLFQYVSADRIGPRDLYDTSTAMVSDNRQLGHQGEYAAHFLNTYGNDYDVPETLRHPKGVTQKLFAQVNAWIKEISPGVSLNTRYFPEANKVLLDYQFELEHDKTNHFLPKNVGFGISYVLPVILALLTAAKGEIVIIENPESHIHPRGQAEMGKLIALAAQNGAQLFVETHSDHILNGIRVAVKESLIEKNNVNILFFDKVTTDAEQYTKITQILVDKNGSLSEYPDNFLDEWSNQLSKLI
ncbi:hypothetical protein FACS1894140_6550 [Spirochaetia bacterium]|nr:hypothetical protein FACS1894140_6550 [Spirochaetia bacterium]